MTTSAPQTPAVGTVGEQERTPTSGTAVAPTKASKLRRGQANWAVKAFLLILCLL